MEEKRPYEEDEITLKELILKAQEYFRYILSQWKVLFVVVLLFVAYKSYVALSTAKTYNAELTFTLNEETGNSMGSLSGLLGNFGFGGAGGKFNTTKILEIAKSFKIIQMLLMEKGIVEGKEDYLANHIIREYKYHEAWEKGKNENLKGFLFTHDSIPAMNKTERLVIKILYGRLLGNHKMEGLLNMSEDDETGIMSLNIKTTSEELSLILTERLYENLSKYYINKTTEQPRHTYKTVKAKVDSIKTELSNKEYQLANFIDRNRGLWTKTDELQRNRLERDVQVLSIMFGEAAKNLEFADFALKSAMPFVQTIDRPFSPIAPESESLVSSIILGILLGLFIGIGFLIFRKLYTDVLKED